MEEREGGETRLQEVAQELQEKNRDGMSGGKKGRWDRGMWREGEVGKGHEERKRGGSWAEGQNGRWNRGFRKVMKWV